MLKLLNHNLTWSLLFLFKLSEANVPFPFQFESDILSNFFNNKFELGFDYSSMLEMLCLVSNDFVDFAEEEIPPKLENIFLKKKDMLGLMWMKTQIINMVLKRILILIGSTLKQEEKSELFNLLKEHKDVFAWSY